MSELTERLEADCGDHCRATCPFCIIRGLLPAHDAEIALAAKREQMEADCRAACLLCKWTVTDPDVRPSVHVPVTASSRSEFKASRGWRHGNTSCQAGHIHEAWAKDHPEDGKHE